MALLLNVENTHFLEDSFTPEFLPQFQEGQKLDQSFEVQVERILGTHGLEGAVPSKRDLLTTSWVLTSRSKNRLVNEVRVPNVSHNVSSTELFSELASSKKN